MPEAAAREASRRRRQRQQRPSHARAARRVFLAGGRPLWAWPSADEPRPALEWARRRDWVWCGAREGEPRPEKEGEGGRRRRKVVSGQQGCSLRSARGARERALNCCESATGGGGQRVLRVIAMLWRAASAHWRSRSLSASHDDRRGAQRAHFRRRCPPEARHSGRALLFFKTDRPPRASYSRDCSGQTSRTLARCSHTPPFGSSYRTNAQRLRLPVWRTREQAAAAASLSHRRSRATCARAPPTLSATAQTLDAHARVTHSPRDARLQTPARPRAKEEEGGKNHPPSLSAHAAHPTPPRIRSPTCRPRERTSRRRRRTSPRWRPSKR